MGKNQGIAIRAKNAGVFTRLGLLLLIEYAGAFGLLLSIGVLLFVNVNQQRKTILSDNTQTQAILVKTIAAKLTGLVRTADQVLFELSVLQSEKRLISKTQKPDFWKIYWRELPESALFFAADAHGKIFVSSQNSLLGGDISQKDFFLAPQTFKDNSRVFISAPQIFLGLEQSVVLSKPVLGLDGKIRGVVGLTFHVRSIENGLAEFQSHDTLSITLTHESGNIIARYPPSPASTSTNVMASGTLFAKHIHTERPISSHTFQSPLDHQEKIGTALTLDTYPIQTGDLLYVSVADVTEAIMAPWKRMRYILWGYGIVALLVTWFGYTSFRRRRENEDARALIEALLATPDMLVMGVRENGVIDLFNTAATKITGYEGEEVLNQNWIQRLVPDNNRKAAQNAFITLLSKQGISAIMETPILTKTGERRILVFRNVLLNRYDGRLVLSMGTDITERRQNEEQLRIQAQIDALTGIPNRRHFLELGARTLSLARRHKTHLSLLMLDIDFFKKINDTYGHAAGDQVLRVFANQCKVNLREEDFMGRLGGEEFAVLLPQTDSAGGHRTAERIRMQIENTPISIDEKTTVHITVSIGLASMLPSDELCEQIIQRADMALYKAKHGGRNRVYEAQPNIQYDQDMML